MMQGNETARAIILMILAMLMLPGMDAIAKWLTGSLSSGQIAWTRFLFQILFMSPLLLRTHEAWFSSTLWMHAARGVFMAGATLLFISGLAYMPLAEAISIFFIEPLLVTSLSALILGETIGWRRWMAITIGFSGTVLIIKPAFFNVGWSTLYPIGAAVCFSIYILLTRRLVANEDPIRLQFFSGVFGCLTLGIALLFGSYFNVGILATDWPAFNEWVLLAVLGLVAAVGHLLVVYAFRRAPVSVLAPFQYVEIIGATVLGFIFFQDFPDLTTWTGILIIVGSGIYVFHREAVVNHKKPQKLFPGVKH